MPSKQLTTMEQVHKLSARRSAIWAGAEHALGEIDRLTHQLADLFEAKRSEAARDQFGRSRDQIVRSAKIETELERLMS